MAVHGCFNPNIFDDSDDDGPAVFKRSHTSSKQNQLSPPPKKSSSQRHDVSSGRRVSDASPGRPNSNFQKGSVVSPTKVLAGKSTLTSSSPSTSIHDQSKHSSKQYSTVDNIAKKPLKQSLVASSVDSEDSDDDKPLSSRFSAASTAVQKGNSSHSSKEQPNLQKSNSSHASKEQPNLQKSNSSHASKQQPNLQKSNSSHASKEQPSSQKSNSSHASKEQPTSQKSNSSLASKELSAVQKSNSSHASKEPTAVQKSNSFHASKEPTAVQKSNSFHASKEPTAVQKSNSFHASKEPTAVQKSNSFHASKEPTAVQKSNSSHASKERTSGSSVVDKTKVNIKTSDDDSEDEKTLSSKFPLKSSVGAATKKLHGSDEKKPLASKFQQNGSSRKDPNGKVSLESPKGLNKRPLGEVNSSAQSSSVKKAKLSEVSLPAKVKLESGVKEEPKADDDDHLPIAARMKKPVSSTTQSSMKKVTKVVSSSFKKVTKKSKISAKNKKSKYSKSTKFQPGSGEGQKWTTLEHNGVIFPPPYKSHGVKMLYNGHPVDLTPEQEEVATMFAVMKDTDYATKQKFLDNFMNDWRVILGKNHIIKKFELCDFTPIYEWHQKEKEKKKQMSTEEKKAVKEEKLKQEEKYMWAIVDGVKEKVGNFRVEPPGLFRGRGEHPKMGKLKRRIRPKDITINIGKGAPVPECPIPGERWKEVKHDNTVTWLAFWNDPINPKEFKYVFLAASSSLKGQSDKEKYEKARLLKDYIHGIRAKYTKDFTNKDTTKRQIAVATYLIDKLALRAGNEKDDDEADTVGCCTLKVENVTLLPPNKLQFDFLGKDSIRYFNTVEVELPVYKAIGQFRSGKKDGDDLFDELDTSKLNAHLKELMPGLTAKVFRTYNASITLDDKLSKETKDGNIPEKIAVYQTANKEVAIICNHQRSVSKSHDAQMTRLNEKMAELKGVLEELKVDLSRAKKGKPPLKDAEGKPKKNLSPEMLEKKIAQTNVKIEKMELDMKIKEDLKTVALGTSKINYLDPRISVAWCKRHEVPIEKIFNKSLLAKFAWAMDVDPDFRF